MKIKKSELYFYELLRDFLHKYLRSYSGSSRRQRLKTIQTRWINTVNTCAHRKKSRLIKLGFTALQKKWFMTSASG